ncbi:hypothetical protein PHYSODRAFT_299963 [Phytophthora sojae]|uniref:Uncharacterized protein n=1 Tax=Phytophthora sojae (strain P6497) TaxID=1094619 RepID=G4ZEL6_PHYSP|nr:hypothetical protein PHYSODRAFT_299963 [Phytophthora sojae]EGZ16539.1 hypothetical protein PHYSODRAFT_299963 [Phytophthora sojae]|eukprot:XP_009525597.1 hypothetical protein PHYSODRAFT_299963 [Phytophthora sojae]
MAHPGTSSSQAPPVTSNSPLAGLALLAAVAGPHVGDAADVEDPDAEDPAGRPPPCQVCAQIATAPTVRLDRPRLDQTLIHNSLQMIQASLRQVEEAFAQSGTDDQLQDEDVELQRDHTAALRHSSDLHHQIDTSTSAARSLIQHCQTRHDWLLDQLQLTNSLLVSRNLDVEALEERVAAADQVQEEMDRLRTTSDATARQIRHQVATLEAQIAAVTNHPDVGPVPPPALARRLQTQDHEPLRLRRAFEAAQQRCDALEQSEGALEEAFTQLRGQIDCQGCRITRLREDLQKNLQDTQRRCTRAEELRPMETERHLKRRSELHDLHTHVDSMRSITAQLEQQVAHWRNTSQIAAQLLHDHQREIEELRQAQAVATQSDQILHYRDGYTRFSNIAEAMGQDAWISRRASNGEYFLNFRTSSEGTTHVVAPTSGCAFTLPIAAAQASRQFQIDPSS